jgi:hypothetical protein
MKIGRNDPCPCGSGKKYKKCCLGKDQEARALASQPPAPASPLPTEHQPRAELAPPPPPREKRSPTPAEKRWEEFEKADREGQYALFLKTLDEPELMDDENAFEMLNVLYRHAVEHNERERYDGLVRLLRERLPNVYAKSACYHASNLVENALESGNAKALAEAAAELADHAHQAADTFSRSVDQVAYHGHLLIARDMLRRAWPHLRDDTDLFEWAQEEYAEQGATLEIYARLTEEPALPGNDPMLLERIRFFFPDLDEEVVARRIDRLTGRAPVAVSPADCALVLERPRRRDAGFVLKKKSSGLLHDLAWEFLRSQQLQGIPVSKAELAREGLVDYLASRATGRLPRGSEPPHGWKGPGGGPTEWLVPERSTFDRFLGQRLSLFDGRIHQAAAVFEVIPAWLHFLEARGLITPERRRQALEQLGPLVRDLRPLADKGIVGTGFAAMLDAWGREPQPATSA